MSDIEVSEQDLRIWAGHLLNHGLGGVKPNEWVMLKGEPISLPLLMILKEMVTAAGGLPDLYLVSPDCNRGQAWGREMALHGTEDQIAQVPDWLVARYAKMGKYVEVLGTERPELLRDWPEDRAQAIARATQPLMEMRLAKPWIISLFATPADAAREGMSLQAYTELLVRASTTDHGQMAAVMQPLHDLMAESSRVRIVTDHPDGRQLELCLGIEGQKVIICDGRRNFPDGEVFTSPDARSVEGEIFVDLPIVFAGKRIQGITLKLEGGRITKFDAIEGVDQLRTIIETDDQNPEVKKRGGSRRLGEVAFGMNTGLDRVLTHPLYVEKVAGTLHVAIGSSYKECYGPPGSDELAAAEAEGRCNLATPHVDIVADARPGGCVREVWLDETRVTLGDDLLWRAP